MRITNVVTRQLFDIPAFIIITYSVLNNLYHKAVMLKQFHALEFIGSFF